MSECLSGCVFAAVFVHSFRLRSSFIELPSTPIQTQHREGRWTIGDKGIIILPMDEQQVNR